jgi:hypothetical protein
MRAYNTAAAGDIQPKDDRMGEFPAGAPTPRHDETRQPLF